MPYEYTTDCTTADDRAIYRMRVFAREIKATTFIRKCSGISDFAVAYGYSTIDDLLNHQGIKFYKSVYDSRPCYYIRLDGVKYVWTST